MKKFSTIIIVSIFIGFGFFLSSGFFDAQGAQYTGFGVQFDVNPRMIQNSIATPLNITFKGNVVNQFSLDQYCSGGNLTASVISPLENGQEAGFRNNIQASNVSNPVKTSSLTPGQQINWDFQQSYTHSTAVNYRLFQGLMTCGGKEVARSSVVQINVSGQGGGGFFGSGGQSGQDVSTGGFSLTPPWAGVDNIFDLLDKLTDFLLNVSIPIAVILIIYAGILFLTSAGNTGRVTKAKSILWYTVLGFSVLLIGKGFYILVESILNLR